MPREVGTMNGYRLLYCPDHHRALCGSGWGGFVYEHIIVAEEMLGRRLEKSEVVHHLDGDRSNNRMENLLILSNNQHGKLHAWLSNGAPGVTSFKQAKKEVKRKKVSCCKICGKMLQGQQVFYCSHECYRASSRKVEHPTRRALLESILSTPFTGIAKYYGVTDNAVRKWARGYGLPSTRAEIIEYRNKHPNG